MPTNIQILSPAEIKSFDQPPVLNAIQRKQFFRPPKTVLDIVASFRFATNKAAFVLLYGYFKATNRFFRPKNFLQSEIDFACKDLGLSGQIKPKVVLESLLNFFKDKKIETPSYFVLASIITTAINEYEKKLLILLSQSLHPEDKHLLDGLLKNTKTSLKLQSYKLTDLKKTSHSLRPMGIRENIEGMVYFGKLFKQLESVIMSLGLDIQSIQYYAGLVIKSQTFQLLRREDNKYLLLICFVIHQYFSLNDLLIDALIQSSQSAKNAALRKHKEDCYLKRQQKDLFMDRALNNTLGFSLKLKDIREIIHQDDISSDEKVNMIKGLFNMQDDAKLEDELNKIKADFKRVKDDNYYDILESFSFRLQNRVSEIIKHVHFDRDSSNQNILDAIDYYKAKDGALSIDAPVDFLDPVQQGKLYNDHKKWRVSLYKVLLVHEIASAMKSGALNLLYSYKYRDFNNYLLSKRSWLENRQNFLERARLTSFQDPKKVLCSIDQILRASYKQVNQNILDDKNPYVRFGPYNHMIVTTPPLKENELSEAQVTDLFPQERFFSLFEILSTINNATGFLNSFEHWKTKMHWRKPDNKTFFAGIIGLGCNLGIKKISRISSNIKPNTLESTVNWYFSLDNLNNANNQILEVIDRLSLPRVFQKDQTSIHTSSDGQKFGIGVDSLHANYSFKYFGKGRGVSSYTFNDDKHRLFYSTVISPSEREAAYVIDGLMQNDVVESDIHSTDTHGYTEIVFAVCHLLGISFAPRIKDFREQRLYSFDPRVNYTAMGYKILPIQKIDMQFIEDEWDNILRFVATIELKHTTASQLFQRLSHYSRQHPLYRAIKSFGRIIKTIFLLKYIDSVELRQIIEKQLNKTESIHKLAKAIFFGSNQEFQHKSKEDQLRDDACKRLIENAIICWNYLYLSNLIYETKDEDERQRIINTIKNGSVVIWQHVNLQGEYDFSDEVLKNSLNFSLPRLMELEVA